MARFRSRMALRPVNRIKHVVDANFVVAANTQINTTLVEAEDATALADTNGVITGAKVNGIYLRVEVASNEAIDLGAVPQVYLSVTKNPGGNITIPTASGVGSNDNKRFVIHQEMAMIENKGQGSNPRTLFNGVIVIPKGFRRFGPKDLLAVSVISPALNIAVCIQCHYKEFR